MKARRAIGPVDPARSRNMAAVKGKNTQPELRVRRALHSVGLRFRLHAAGLPGRPDIVLPGRRLAIFVHGCFWHRHPRCRFAATPATRREFWLAKFAANVQRDAANRRDLRRLGWRVVVIWECQTRDIDRLMARMIALGNHSLRLTKTPETRRLAKSGTAGQKFQPSS